MAFKYFQLIKDSWNKAVTNPVLGLFFVLFLIAINFLATYALSAKHLSSRLIFYVCIFMTLTAFFSGWFNLIKETVSNKEAENKINFSTFIEGIGKNTASAIIGVIIYITCISVILIAVGQLCFYLFGSPEEIFKEIFPILQDTKAFGEYLNKISPEKQMIILGWELAVYLSASIVHFIFFFYVPALFSNEKTNFFLKPFLAIKDTFIFICKNFPIAFMAFLTIQLLNLFLTTILTIFSTNSLLSLITLFAYIYFIIFSIMLIFNCYEQKNNSDNRSNCIREDECSDKTGEET